MKLIRKEHGDFFGIAVAGYPEGHIDHFKDTPAISEADYKLDLQYLKDKVPFSSIPARQWSHSAPSLLGT